MGGCCCSSRNSHLIGTPVYYYCPQGPSSGTRASVGTGITTGLLVDIGLETTSIPDTFRAPAPPLPYDLLLGRPRPDSESIITCKEDSSVILSPRKSNVKGCKQIVDEEEEDSCPICFEGYDLENPRLTTKCEHDFHLSCLLEWIERSDTCPICDKEVVFDDCLN